MQVLRCGSVGDANRRGALQGCGFLCHHLGSWQQQFASACARELSRQLQTAAEAVLVRVAEGWREERRRFDFCSISWVTHFCVSRNCKPRNRPSFRQILLHLDIASADILSTPQETYFQTQASLFDYGFIFLLYYTMSSLPQARRHHKERREKEIKLIWSQRVVAALTLCVLSPLSAGFQSRRNPLFQSSIIKVRKRACAAAAIIGWGMGSPDRHVWCTVPPNRPVIWKQDCNCVEDSSLAIRLEPQMSLQLSDVQSADTQCFLFFF